MTGYEAGLGGRPAEDPYEGRRQLDQLSAAELRDQPAWWFPGPDRHLTGPDESTVMPVEVDATADGTVEFPDGRYLLHVVFTLANGDAMDGHVTYSPGDRGDLADREPTICTPAGQVPLWYGVLAPAAEQIVDALRRLDRSREEVFPVHWETTLHPPQETISGDATGFAVWQDGAVGHV